MKRIITIITVLLTAVIAVQAQEKRMSKEEFQARQRQFITEVAGLTESEADKFFPLYFELQGKKNELNREMWDNMHKAKERELTEEEYESITETIAKLRIESDELELEYLRKYKKFLSSKKIFQIIRAEMRFHREFLRDAKDKKGPK